MSRSASRFFRENAFLAAAVLLPVVVVGLFLLSAAIPRWTVPPPQYDLLLRAPGPYDQTQPRIAVDYRVRDGRVEAIVRPLAKDAYSVLSTLFLFDHKTMDVREIPINLPDDVKEGDPPRTIVIDALAGREVLAQTRAPDGYEMRTRDRYGGPGIVGDLFGMNRYDQSASLVKNGRVIRLALPSPARYQSPVTSVGWLDDGQR